MARIPSQQNPNLSPGYNCLILRKTLEPFKFLFFYIKICVVALNFELIVRALSYRSSIGHLKTKYGTYFYLQGDILFLHMSKDPIRSGEIVVFNVDVRILILFPDIIHLYYCM